jgi:hypothetical protein
MALVDASVMSLLRLAGIDSRGWFGSLLFELPLSAVVARVARGRRVFIRSG